MTGGLAARRSATRGIPDQLAGILPGPGEGPAAGEQEPAAGWPVLQGPQHDRPEVLDVLREQPALSAFCARPGKDLLVSPVGLGVGGWSPARVRVMPVPVPRGPGRCHSGLSCPVRLLPPLMSQRRCAPAPVNAENPSYAEDPGPWRYQNYRGSPIFHDLFPGRGRGRSRGRGWAGSFSEDLSGQLAGTPDFLRPLSIPERRQQDRAMLARTYPGCARSTAAV